MICKLCLVIVVRSAGGRILMNLRSRAGLHLVVLSLVILSVSSGIVLTVALRICAAAATTTTTSSSVVAAVSCLTAVTGVTTTSAAAGVTALRGTIALVPILLRVECRLPHLGTAPRWNIGPSTAEFVRCATKAGPAAVSATASGFAQLCHEGRIFSVEVGLSKLAGRSVRVRLDSTVTRHMPSAAANAADDVGGEVALLWTVIFAMTESSAVLADLILVVTQGTVQRREFTKLVALVIVLTFRGGSGLKRMVSMNERGIVVCAHRFNNSVNHLDASCDLILRVSHDQAMQIFFSVISKLIRFTLPFLNAAFAPNTDFRATVPFHLLQTIAARADQKTKEIDFREFLDRDVNLFRWALRSLLLVVFSRWAEIRVSFESSIDKPDAFVF